MILVLSQGTYERSTDDILSWLHYKNAPTKRVNGEDLLGQSECLLFSVRDKEMRFLQCADWSSVSVIFYRRFAALHKQLVFNTKIGTKLNSKLFNFAVREHQKIYDFFIGHFPDAHKVSSYYDEKLLNKLDVLYIAKKLGLQVPETIITNNKKDIEKFIEKHLECIIKPVYECDFFIVKGVFYKMLSKKIGQSHLSIIPEQFFPSCFQEYINKDFEIRTFYIEGACFSMAIFSQFNSRTSVDYRNYDLENPNRTVPYKLPNSVEKKINKLMARLNLTIGSIDLIKSRKGDYVFLEVNPNGQFGMVSYPCNYFLERKIAQHLIKLANEK